MKLGERLDRIGNNPFIRPLAILACAGALILLVDSQDNHSASTNAVSGSLEGMPQNGTGSFEDYCLGTSGPGDVINSSSLIIRANMGTQEQSFISYPDSPFCPPVGFVKF